jgi:hypothetical protein
MSPKYSEEPTDKTQFTADFDDVYTQFAWVYDFSVKALPFWKTWIKQALPHIRGLSVWKYPLVLATCSPITLKISIPIGSITIPTWSASPGKTLSVKGSWLTCKLEMR